jgi:hypothetical protein
VKGGGLGGPKGGLNVMIKRKDTALAGDWNLTILCVASLFTKWTVPILETQ